MSRRHLAAVVLSVAAMVGGCAAASPRPQEPSASPASTSNPGTSQGPSSPSQAFLDGYRAWRNHDLATAVDRLGYAAEHYPPLADYALFYLASAERDRGDLASSAANFERLFHAYPESVMTPDALVALAGVYLRLTRANDSAAAASKAIANSLNVKTEQAARLALARAVAAEGSARSAYDESMTLREKYPLSTADGEARELAYSILAANPEVANVNSLGYHRDQAALLLKEGQPASTLRQVRDGLALAPPPAIRAEFIFLKALALHSSPPQAEAAYEDYLQLAPAGPSAPAATEAIALIYWHRDDRDRARTMFRRLIARFPNSHLAPRAELRIGRTFEEDRKYDSARAEYAKLIARYPSSDAADEARFRVPWTSYMTGHFANAARGFAAMRAHATAEGGSRDMLTYWEARSKEKSGDRAGARELFEILSQSIDSNYYPALASRRVEVQPPQLPAAGVSDLQFNPAIQVEGRAAFHVERVLTLREMGLKELEPAELQQLGNHVGQQPSLRGFVLAGFQSAGAYYDAIVAATRMEKRGELSRDVAERVRYPRAYWDLIASSASRNGLDPYLVLALMRQESLFNSEANSSSDARGLMQLLPTTGKRIARDTGVMAPLNLYDPALSVELGTAYLRQLFAMFNGHEILAVAAYNGGEHAVQGWLAKFPGDDDEWVENIGYKETREYVKRVIGGEREYRLLYPSPAVALTAPAGSDHADRAPLHGRS